MQHKLSTDACFVKEKLTSSQAVWSCKDLINTNTTETPDTPASSIEADDNYLLVESSSTSSSQEMEMEMAEDEANVPSTNCSSGSSREIEELKEEHAKQLEEMAQRYRADLANRDLLNAELVKNFAEMSQHMMRHDAHMRQFFEDTKKWRESRDVINKQLGIELTRVI